MMLALWFAVTRWRRYFRAYSNAKRAMRVDARSVMILMLSTMPGTISCSRPAYRSSVFSRTTIRSTPWKRLSTPGRFLTGRRLENRSRALRSPTFTLVKPSPIGVVTGPFSATLFLFTDSRSCGGSDWPKRLNAITPASCGSHAISRPAAVKMRTTASVTSGPIPSPGIRVMVCGITSVHSSQFTVHSSQFTVHSSSGFRQGLGQQAGDLLEQRAVGGPERRRLIAVDIDLAEDPGSVHDRHDDLRPGLEAARQIPRIRVHIVHDDRGLFGRGGAADPATEGNACVRGRFAEERAERQLLAVDQGNAHPRVVRQRVLEELHRLPHRGCRVGGGGNRGSNRDEQLAPRPRAARSLTLTRVHVSYSLSSQKM